MTRRVVIFVASLVLLAAGAGPSLADTPFRVGWWTVANPGLPPLIAGVEFPINNVPDGGFEVAGNAESPTSVAALLYDVPEGATVGPLVITVAEGIPAAPATTLQACPVRGEFKTDDGGPMADAPEWDCTDPSPGTVDAAGQSFSFDVARFVADEQLSVAIVPAVSAQATFAPPGDDSLVVREADVAPAPTPTTPSGVGAVPDSGGFEPLPSLDAAGLDAAGGLADTPPIPAAPRSGSPLSTAVVASSDGSGAGSAVIGSVIVALLGCLVWVRGRRALNAAIASRDA